MRSSIARALDRAWGGQAHGEGRLVDLSPLPCPNCTARIAADHTGVWRCRAGHRFPTTRALIAALIASGWRPALEIQRGPAAQPGSGSARASV